MQSLLPSPWELSELSAQGTEIQKWISIAAAAITPQPWLPGDTPQEAVERVIQNEVPRRRRRSSELEEVRPGIRAARPLIRDAQPSWRGQAGAEMKMLPAFWQVRTVEPEAALCSGVSQIRAAEQKTEADPAWLFLHHRAFDALEDNCQGQGQACSGPSRDVGGGGSSAPPHLKPLSFHPLCLACHYTLPLFPVWLSATKCGVLSAPPTPFLATEPGRQLYKWWALLNLLPQLHPQTHEPSPGFPHKTVKMQTLGVPPR